MTSEELIKISIKAGWETEEYCNHYTIRRAADTNVVVTIPKSSCIVAQLLEAVKTILGL